MPNPAPLILSEQPFQSRFTRFRPRFSLPARAVLFLAITTVSCRAASLAYGPDLASAKNNADGVFSALEQRYTRVHRDAKYGDKSQRGKQCGRTVQQSRHGIPQRCP
ncbi:MAG: hypothetical protein ABI120_14325, partial [Gemmatimonadaceae bacterium]